MTEHWRIVAFIVISLLATALGAEQSKDDYFDNVKITEANSKEFVDPHAFRYSEFRKLKAHRPQKSLLDGQISQYPSSDNNRCQEKCRKCIDKNPSTDWADGLHEKFIERLINLLLSNAALKDEGDYVYGKIHFSATNVQMEILRKYGNGEVTIRQIEGIFSQIIQSPPSNIIKKFMDTSWHISLDWLNNVSDNLNLRDHLTTHMWSLIVTGSAIIIVYILFTIRWTAGTFIKVFVLSAILVSFFLTWWNLLKEAEIKLTAKQMKYMEIPVECRPHEMSFLDRVSSYFRVHDDCEKYFEAVMTDHRYQVTPVQVFSHLVTTVILEPLRVLGTVFDRFVHDVTGNLGIGMRWIVVPMLYTGLIGALIMVPFCLCGGSIGLGFGPLLRFSLSADRKKNEQTILQPPARTPVEYIREVNQEALQRQIEGGAENSSRKESPISVNQIQDECNPEKSGLCKSCKRSCAGADTTAKPEKGSGDTFSSGDDHQLAVENNHQNVQEGDGDK